MIAMALSITVKAVELKKTSASSPTIPTTSRWARKLSTCSVTAAAWLGITSWRFEATVSSSRCSSTTCDRPTSNTTNSGTIASSV